MLASSTPQQDVRSQRLAILEYARANDVRIDEFIEATASGQASEKRRRLDELTGLLQRGDRLVVSELSRLGRSLGQVVAVLDALAKAGVAFVALKENIRVEGKRDIQTKVMTTLFALFAEVERDLISERTREGLARARSSGRKLGRPKGSLGVSRLDGKEDEIRRFLELGVSKTAIRQANGRVPNHPVQLHEHPRAQAAAFRVYFCTNLVGTLIRGVASFLPSFSSPGFSGSIPRSRAVFVIDADEGVVAGCTAFARCAASRDVPQLPVAVRTSAQPTRRRGS